MTGASTAGPIHRMETTSGFKLDDAVAVVTGGTGVLGSSMARGLAGAGAKVAILGRREQRAHEIAEEIRADGGQALPLPADVLDRGSLESALGDLLATWNRVDVLVNAAGGNRADATVVGDLTLFDLGEDAFRKVVDLNLTGTLLATQVFGEPMAEQQSGSIINISSMAAQRPLTRVIGYAAAKAGVDNLTRWLAVHVAQKYGEGVRVNAIAPGFFVGEQNRDLLLNGDGTLTDRGQQIIDHTPMERFGNPEDLTGTVVWLASNASRFVTGVVVPVDGGYAAFGGV